MTPSLEFIDNETYVMFGFFNTRRTVEQNERFLLISEGLKSGLPLSEALRLTTLARHGSDRPYLQLADLLDQGIVPVDAVKQVNFPAEIKKIFINSLMNSASADILALHSQLSRFRYQMIEQFCNAVSYPLFLLFIAMMVFHCILITIIPNCKQFFEDCNITIPPLINLVFSGYNLLAEGWIYLSVLCFFTILYFLQKTFIPRLWYYVPFFGTLLHRMIQDYLFNIIAFSLERDIPFNDILISCSKMTRNRAFKNDLKKAAAEAENGSSMIDLVLKYNWLFPIWLAPMLFSNQNSKNKGEIFYLVAQMLRSKTEASVFFLRMLALMGSLIFIGFFTGLFVLAFFIPVIELIKSLSC